MITPEILQKKKSIVEYYLKKKILLSREILLRLQSQQHIEDMYKKIHILPKKITQEKKSNYSVVVKKEFFCEKENYSVDDFTAMYRKRFRALEGMLQQRQELQNLIAIRRLEQRSVKETVSIIGMVFKKSETKNGNILFTIEDLSGTIKVVVSKKSPAYEIAKDTQEDEIIGIIGSLGDNIIFANNILYPDVPLATEIKKAQEEVYMIVLSDIHLGSKLFLPERFQKFIDWLKGEYGSEEEKEIAKKVGYVLIPGDIVDGVGVFPGQKEELEIQDIYTQYKEIAHYLSQIPSDKKIVYSPGNHDAARLAEPQPRLTEKFSKPLYDLPNITFVTNPAIVTIHKQEDFPGFDCLLYHGGSYIYCCDKISSIKDSGINVSDRTGIIMKYLLQRRHLAPTYTSTRILPNRDEDSHVIQKIPDFFISGHIHKAITTSYRGVSILVGSCFQSNSAYQEKFGHAPMPGQIPVINLKTRKTKILEF